MAKKLNMPAPKAGGGAYTDRFQVQEGKNIVRVFPFEHDGETYLAVPNVVVHFENGNGKPVPCLGKDCPMCREAARTKDRRLRAVTRYPMAVHPILPEAEDKPVLKFDAPSSVYAAIFNLVQENGEDILGNEGLDIIINYDKKKQGSEKYHCTLKAKGCETLEINDSDVPDLMAEWLNDQTAGTVAVVDEDEEPEVNDKEVVFKSVKGKEMTGTYTCVMQGDKYVIEADGQTYSVPAERIVSGIEGVGEVEPDEEPGEEEQPKTKAKKPAKAPAWKVGKEATYADPDQKGKLIDVKIVELDLENGTATVSCDEYEDFEVELADLNV